MPEIFKYVSGRYRLCFITRIKDYLVVRTQANCRMTNEAKMKKWCFFILLASSLNVSAQWYEAIGEADIRRGDKQNAKQRAIQDAVKHALLFSGSAVSSIQQVSDGILTGNDFSVTSSGAINSIEIINELHTSKTLSVTLRVDITETYDQCGYEPFSKNIAITQFNIANREHARIGGIYSLGENFSNKLSKLINKDNYQINAKPWFMKKLAFTSLTEDYFTKNKQLIQHIADNTQSHYVLFGNFVDLSLGEQTSSDLSFWSDEQHERYMSLDIAIIDTYSMEIVHQEQLDDSANWGFELNKRVPSQNKRFWHSPYGEMLTKYLNQIEVNIAEKLACEPLVGKIVSIRGNEVKLNIGKANGIKPGMNFKIGHKQPYRDEQRNLISQYVVSPHNLVITHTNRNTATAKSIDDKLLGNVQVGDIITLSNVTSF